MDVLTILQVGLLVGLLGVAATHTRSRLAGAFVASAWCAGALVFGALAFREGPPLSFLGVATPPWLYYGFLTGLLLFNVLVIVRALRRRRLAAGTSPSPAGS